MAIPFLTKLTQIVWPGFALPCYFYRLIFLLKMLISVFLLYLSAFNMLEEILNKEQLAKAPSKTLKAKLKIMGGDYQQSLTQAYSSFQ